MTTAKDGIIARAAKALSDVESNELKATLVSTLFVFVLMASYYILRPVRDAMASDWTDSEVSFLWNINFFVSAAIVALYGYAVSRMKLRNVVPVLYGFFALTFVAFYLSISLVTFSDFDGGATAVVANPDKSGINASAKVGQLQKFGDEVDGADETNKPSGGTTLDFGGNVDWAAGEVWTMKVRSARVVPVLFKWEGLDQERTIDHGGSDTWEELCFDFTGTTGGAEATALTLIFDNGVIGDATGDPANWTFEFDDIQQVTSCSAGGGSNARGVTDFEDDVDKLFYLWISVFSLFNVSVFWTLMADTFNPDQAKRLFGIIGAGASAGALFGPAIPALFAGVLGTDTLMLIASSSLMIVVPLVFYLYHLKGAELGNTDLAVDTSKAIIGGNWWQGFRSFIKNPYLLGIGGFILLYVFIGSFVYFGQKNLLAEFTRAERTQILGSVDWIVNLVTFGMAFFLTGRIVSKVGMPTALALMPFLVGAGLLILAFAPVLTVLLALQVFRRGGNYGLTRPAREMLYTKVTQEERFKSKPVIDIVVYRGGDAISGTLFAFLTDGIGLGLAAVALVGSAIAAAWGSVGIWLGKQFDSGHDLGGKNE